MKKPSYTINKGVNRPLEFRGLQAQYIAWLAVGMLTLLILFAGLFIIGVNPYICLVVIAAAGLALTRQVYYMSKKYGQYGWMKKQAARRLPQHTRIRSRKPFQ